MKKLLILTLCATALSLNASDDGQGCSGVGNIAIEASQMLIELANGFDQYEDLNPDSQIRAEQAQAIVRDLPQALKNPTPNVFFCNNFTDQCAYFCGQLAAMARDNPQYQNAHDQALLHVMHTHQSSSGLSLV